MGESRVGVGRRQRMLIGVVAVLGLVVGFIGFAPSAYAHHSNVELTPVCNEDTGNIDVTLRIFNSQGTSQPMTIDDVVATGFTTPPAPGDGTVIPGGSSGNWVQWNFTLPGTQTGTISYFYAASWANGVEDNDNFASTDLPENCDGPTLECRDVAPGTELIAKFEVKGGNYVFEKPAGNENVVTLSNENLDGGDWASTIPISAVIVKGGPNTDTTHHDPAVTSGSFDNGGLPRGPDISNLQFCGDPNPTGSLDITKVTAGNSAPAGTEYTITYNGPVSGQVVLEGGETETVTDLPYGVYTLAEPDPPAGASAAISPNPVTIDAEHQSVSVTVTNTFADLGGFRVTKDVTGQTTGYVAGSEFTVGYDCDDGSNGSLSLADGETDGVDGLPIGTECTLEETARPSTSGPSYAYGPESWSPSNQVVIALNDQDDLVYTTLTNPITRIRGGFSVTKAVTGETAGYVAGSEFTVGYDCDDGSNGSLSLADGETDGVGGLPIGTECTLEETARPSTSGPSYAYGAETWNPSNVVTVVENDNDNVVSVGLENPIVRRTGGFEVTKTVTGETAGYVAGSEFTVGYDCDDGSNGSLSLADGETDGVGGLPLGTECTLEETARPSTSGPSYAYGPESWDPSDVVTITTEGQRVSVGLENPIVRLYGSFEITKTVTGETAGYVAGSAFTVAYDCDGGPSGSLILEDGETAGVGLVPVGSTCTLDETAKPSTSGPSYMYGPESWDPSNVVTISEARQRVSLDLENPIVRLRGGFSVTKIVTGETEGYVGDSTFAVDYDCDDGSNGTLSLAAGDTDAVQGLPVGTECTLEETGRPSTSGPSYAYGPESWNPSNMVTISEAGQAVAVELENPIVRLYGSFDVTKAVTGETDGYVPGSAFTVSYDCDDGSNGSWEIENGETAGLGLVPVGTTCTLDETARPSTSGPSYAYGPESWDPSNVVTVSESGQHVSVGLENPVVRLLGDLEVTKTVADATEGYVPGSVFGFALDCDDDGFDQDFSLEAGQTSSFTGIPLGTSCTVEEIELPEPAPGYEYGTVTFDPADATVVVSSTTEAVAVGAVNEIIWLPSPEASVVGDCESAAAIVTLSNTGGGEVAFTVTVDGEPVGDPVVVASESTEEVVVPMDEDQVASIAVTAPGFGVVLEQEIDLDCQEPAASIVPECSEGGVVVTLTNDGESPVELTVLVDDEAFVTETVGDEPVEVLVPLEEDQTAEISVRDGDELVASETVTFDCEDEPEITTAVLPALLTRTPGSETLPVTGGGLSLAVAGLILLVVGGGLLTVRRRATV